MSVVAVSVCQNGDVVMAHDDCGPFEFIESLLSHFLVIQLYSLFGTATNPFEVSSSLPQARAKSACF